VLGVRSTCFGGKEALVLNSARPSREEGVTEWVAGAVAFAGTLRRVGGSDYRTD